MGGLLKWLIGPIAGPVLGGGLALVAIAFAVTVGTYHLELANVTGDRDALKAQIYAEGTGLIARNTQCETNFGGIMKALDNARGDINALADETKKNNDLVSSQLATANAGVRNVQATAAKLLATPPSAPPGTIAACFAGARIIKTGAP